LTAVRLGTLTLGDLAKIAGGGIGALLLLIWACRLAFGPGLSRARFDQEQARRAAVKQSISQANSAQRGISTRHWSTPGAAVRKFAAPMTKRSGDIAPEAIKSFEPDDFLRALGAALLAWQAVEDSTYRLFHALLRTDDLTISDGRCARVTIRTDRSDLCGGLMGLTCRN